MYRYVCVDAYSNIYMFRSMHIYIQPYVIIIMKKEAMNLRISKEYMEVFKGKDEIM